MCLHSLICILCVPIQVIKLQTSLKHMHEVAKARLHLACALSHSRQHKKAIVCLGKVVDMVERGDLEGGGSSAEKLCLVAVCYHNIAVEQLILKRFVWRKRLTQEPTVRQTNYATNQPTI